MADAHWVNRLTELFVPAFRDVAQVSILNPVRLGERSEPQPDLAPLRRAPGRRGPHNPGPAEVFLLVEVTEFSLEPDRRAKVSLYARSGIPEVWLVDLERETVTVYRDSDGDPYSAVPVARRGESVAPESFPDCPIALAEVLPE